MVQPASTCQRELNSILHFSLSLSVCITSGFISASIPRVGLFRGWQSGSKLCGGQQKKPKIALEEAHPSAASVTILQQFYFFEVLTFTCPNRIVE
jgi:hypothetical protein